LQARVFFQLEANFEEEIEEFDYLLGYAHTSIGEWSVGAIYQIEHDRRSIEGNRETLHFRNPKIARRFSYKKSSDQFRDELKIEFEMFRSSFQTSTAIIMDGDLVSWGKAFSEENSKIKIEVS